MRYCIHGRSERQQCKQCNILLKEQEQEAQEAKVKNKKKIKK